MTPTIQAAVHTGERRIRLQGFERPVVPIDGALLRVEAAGICGADIGAFARGAYVNCILGHENVGTIEEIGEVAAKRWGVQPGDRLVLEEYLPCWHCDWCRMGEYRLCYQTDRGQNPAAFRFGSVGIDVPPSLWGGYSQVLYVPGHSVVHRLSPSVPAELASLTLPIANGIQWTIVEGGVGIGSSVLIMGPGQQGLGCVIAAAQAGARQIILTGLASDARRLEVGRRLGAHHVIIVDEEPVEDRVRELTEGTGPDVVVDATSATSPDVLMGALRMIKRKGGTLVMQGLNTPVVDGFPLGLVASKYVNLKVARGHSSRAVSLALRLIESRHPQLGLVATHTVGLGELVEGLQLTRTDPTAIHVVVDPWR